MSDTLIGNIENIQITDLLKEKNKQTDIDFILKFKNRNAAKVRMRVIYKYSEVLSTENASDLYVSDIINKHDKLKNLTIGKLHPITFGSDEELINIVDHYNIDVSKASKPLTQLFKEIQNKDSFVA